MCDLLLDLHTELLCSVSLCLSKSEALSLKDVKVQVLVTHINLHSWLS
jgi:hypothetical protein